MQGYLAHKKHTGVPRSYQTVRGCRATQIAQDKAAAEAFGGDRYTPKSNMLFGPFALWRESNSTLRRRKMARV